MHRRELQFGRTPGVGDPLDDEVVVEVVDFSESVKDGGEIGALGGAGGRCSGGVGAVKVKVGWPSTGSSATTAP